MGIHIIVDGYNLIRSSPTLSRQESHSLMDGREALISRLKAYKSVRKWPVTLVFDASDGLGTNARPVRSGGIQIVYSPLGQTADDVIVKMAEKYGQRAMVITSDRALAEASKKYGATTMNSEDFESRMELAICSTHDFKDDEDDSPPPTLSTRKKGPSRKKPKKSRLKSVRLKKI